eukprot:530973-Rhodomonas_salina.1
MAFWIQICEFSNPSNLEFDLKAPDFSEASSLAANCHVASLKVAIGTTLIRDMHIPGYPGTRVPGVQQGTRVHRAPPKHVHTVDTRYPGTRVPGYPADPLATGTPGTRRRLSRTPGARVPGTRVPRDTRVPGVPGTRNTGVR